MTAEQIERIRERIEQEADIPLKELIEKEELPVSESRLCRIMNEQLGLRRKKNGKCVRTGT